MKKTIFISALVLAAVISTLVYSQSSPETNSRIRDKTATTQANVSAMGATQPATNTGLNTVSGCYYYGGATWDRWTGETWDATLATTAAPVGISLSSYYDASAGAGARWHGREITDAMTVTPSAPYTIALNAFVNDTTGQFQRWHGEDWDTDITVAADAPATIALGAFYDLGTTTGYRWQGEPWDGNMSATPTNPNVNSFGVFRDNVANTSQYWYGETVDSSMTAAPVAPFTAAYNVFYNGTNAQYWQGSILSSETTANTTYAPHAKDMLHAYDATSGSWRWVNVIDSQADGQASTLNGMVTSSINYAYNGTTFDMMRVGASNELQTTDIATRPGEDAANDWRKVKKEQTGVYTPAATTGTAVTAGTSPVIVLAAIEVLADVNWCVYLKNTDGGADAFTDAFIDTSPNNSDWVTLTWTECDSLAAGATCVYCVSNNAYRYIRARVSSAADLTVSAWYVSNKG